MGYRIDTRSNPEINTALITGINITNVKVNLTWYLSYVSDKVICSQSDINMPEVVNSKSSQRSASAIAD